MENKLTLKYYFSIEDMELKNNFFSVKGSFYSKEMADVMRLFFIKNHKFDEQRLIIE